MQTTKTTKIFGISAPKLVKKSYFLACKGYAVDQCNHNHNHNHNINNDKHSPVEEIDYEMSHDS